MLACFFVYNSRNWSILEKKRQLLRMRYNNPKMYSADMTWLFKQLANSAGEAGTSRQWV
jgi:hypothetical protein